MYKCDSCGVVSGQPFHNPQRALESPRWQKTCPVTVPTLGPGREPGSTVSCWEKKTVKLSPHF